MDQQPGALERMGEAAKTNRAAKSGARTANQVVVEDNALRPFSARLTAKGIMRLKAFARDEGVNPSDLHRRLLEDGMDRLEAKKRAQVDPQEATITLGQIVDLLERAGLVDRHLRRNTEI